MAAKLQLLAEGHPGELLVLVQVPELLPSAAPPPAPDLAAARQRSLRREDQPPAAIAQGLKSLPAGKVHCQSCNQHLKPSSCRNHPASMLALSQGKGTCSAIEPCQKLQDWRTLPSLTRPFKNYTLHDTSDDSQYGSQ